MTSARLLIPSLLILGSCSSPPKPPTVDESQKRPANAAAAVELQACKGDLQSSRILVAEKSRAAEYSRASLDRLAALQRAPPATEPGASDARSTVYTILFPFAGTKVDLPLAQAEQLSREAQLAPLVLLSGRTDGTSESAAESRIARERAEAVRSYLVAAGVSPARIRTTWQPVGDHAAGNTFAGGRALNRRVEIEIYRLAPRMAQLGLPDPS